MFKKKWLILWCFFNLFTGLVNAQNYPDPDKSVWSKNVRIFNPPTDTSELASWRRSLINWRANELKTYKSDIYQEPGYEWVQSCYTTVFFIIHDSKFYNRETGEYNVDGFVNYYTKEYGKIDAVIMWHLSPQIGFDDRNQFDFFRNMPGGLKGLSNTVQRFHQKGIKFFINHNPSNTGGWQNDNLRPESPADPSGGPEAMASIVRAVNADGVFLNTYSFGGKALRTELDKIKPGIVIEGETDLKTAEEIANQHMEWFQGWYSLPYSPGGVIRNKWLERRHMIQNVFRNTKDHTKELHAAWMNGIGMVVWDNVFGIWRGWNEQDKSVLRSITPIQRRYHNLFMGEGWTPIVPVLQPDIFASLWQDKDIRLWTLINNSSVLKDGGLISIEMHKGDLYFDLVSGKEIKPLMVDGKAILSCKINAKGVGGFLAAPASTLGNDFKSFLASQAVTALRENLSAEFVELPMVLKSIIPTQKYSESNLPDGMVKLNDTVYIQKDTVRSRESGSYDNDIYLGGKTTYRKVSITKIAIDEKLVTNAQYKKFLKSSGYKPRFSDNFLKHLEKGHPHAGTDDSPVVYVDIDDARAYAKWAGKRLPTLEEWQYAMETGKPKYGSTRVWEWNESERYDGRVRFSMLKGGSDWAATGSKFYSTGGPQSPTYSAKYLFMYPGLDRVWTIGFSCVVDVQE